MDEYGKIANGVYLMKDLEPVLVSSQSDLSKLAGARPGTIAMTAGGKLMWMLGADGTTWVQMPGIE